MKYLSQSFLNKKQATVIEYFDVKTEQKFLEKKDTFLTQQDKIDLIEKIETSKTDIIKWMFAFWVGTIGIAILFYLLRK